MDDSTAPAFRALADPSRRLLLDRLFERDGQSLGELTAYLPDMTRFGVMRHLDVLESCIEEVVLALTEACANVVQHAGELRLEAAQQEISRT